MTTKTPRNTPAPAARRARSATKRARPMRRGKGGTYSDAQRTEALRLVATQGMAHAHKVTGVPKSTLSRWAKAAGVDTEGTARQRTAAATEAVRARAATVRLSTVELLEAHIAQAGQYLATVAGANAHAADLIAGLDPDLIEERATIAGPVYLATDPDALAAQKVAAALAGLPLAPRDAEGLLTRAIHDLQLLKGEATERGELVVEFGVPRPNPGATRVVDQDQLGGEQP